MQLTDRQTATIFAALIAWEDELSEGERWLTSIYDFGEHTPLSKQEVRDLRDQLRKGGHIAYEPDEPAMWKMSVPTYVGAQPHEEKVDWPDFAQPMVPVLVHEFEGVRVIMGSHDRINQDQPDLQIERRPHGWAIFIHPNGGDPVACIYILDNGRTFLIPEKYTEPSLETVDDIPAELDAPYRPA
ncbi:MAG: hypothetical protein L0Y70_16945 [Gemmataceae bacterium]|nr:hypothetical protein [Gemmataceae bacterium]